MGGWRSKSRARMRGASPVMGTNSRSRQPMISLTRPSAFRPCTASVAEAGELDAGGVHDGGAPQGKAAGKGERPAARERRPRFLGRGSVLRGAKLAQQRGWDEAADDALAPGCWPLASSGAGSVGLEAVDARIILGQALPDRQQQPGHHMKAALGELRHGGELRLPQAGEGGGVGLLPMAPVEAVGRDAGALHGPDQADAALDGAVVEREAGGAQLDGGAMRPGVGKQDAAGGVSEIERFLERERAVAVLARHLVEPRLGAGRGMGGDGAAAEHDEALGPDGLEARVVGARGDGALDLGFQQLLELGEELVLHADLEREHAVEEGGDGRQVLAQGAVLIGEAEPGRLGEAAQRAALDVAPVEPLIELAQRRPRIGALQIVLGAEEPLPAGLALAARDGAEAVEAAGDRREEALLAAHVGGDGPEQRRGGLVGAVGAAQPLDGGVRLPAGFQQIVHARAPVAGGKIGVIAAPRSRRRPRTRGCSSCRP